VIYSFNILTVLQDTVFLVTNVTKLYISVTNVSSHLFPQMSDKCLLITSEARVTAAIQKSYHIVRHQSIKKLLIGTFLQQ